MTSESRGPSGEKQVSPLPPSEVRLRDGVYLLRPLRPGDEETLREFFYSHNAETVYQRYGYTLRDMTRERAHTLVSVDQARDPALGVFEPGTQGGRLDAVGRYYLDAGGAAGEVAFVTRESKRRCGMGSLLLEALVALARERGLEGLWGQVLMDNQPMIALFERHGFKRVRTGDGAVEVRLDLRPDTPDAPGEGSRGAAPKRPRRTRRSDTTGKG